MNLGDRVVLKLLPLTGHGYIRSARGGRWLVVFDELPNRLCMPDEIMPAPEEFEEVSDV